MKRRSERPCEHFVQESDIMEVATVTCPECGARLKLDHPSAAGKIIQCFMCRQRFRVPAEASAS